MSLQTKVMEAMKVAMKAKDAQSLQALRAVKSALLLAQTESGAGANLTLKATSNSFNTFTFDSNRSADTQFSIIDGRWNGNG